MPIGRLSPEDPLLRVRQRGWRRLLGIYAVVGVVCVALAWSSDFWALVLYIGIFAALNLPVIWFLFFRTVPEDRISRTD